jgi:hypothetical protein
VPLGWFALSPPPNQRRQIFPVIETGTNDAVAAM